MLKHFQQVHPAWYSLTGALTGLLKHAGSKSCIKLMFVIVVCIGSLQSMPRMLLSLNLNHWRILLGGLRQIRPQLDSIAFLFHSCGFLCFDFLLLFAVLCARNRKDEKPDSIWDDEETLESFEFYKLESTIMWREWFDSGWMMNAGRALLQ